MVGAEWLSIREAAELAGVSQNTIRNWVASGHLATTNEGPRMVDAADVAVFLAARRAAEAAGVSVATLLRLAEDEAGP